MQFVEESKVFVKGYMVLLDDKEWQLIWVQLIIDFEDFRNVIFNRMNLVMKRYKGRLIGWDVMNENLYYSYYEDMFGKNVLVMIYFLVFKIDFDILLFINEYNIVEYVKGGVGSLINVKNKMEEIVLYLGNMNIKGGIGV